MGCGSPQKLAKLFAARTSTMQSSKNTQHLAIKTSPDLPFLDDGICRSRFDAKYGSALLADSLAVLRALPAQSVNLVMTSPPYALHFKKEYGNASKQDYIG